MTFPWLTVMSLLPIAGGVVLSFVKGQIGRVLGFGVSLVTLVLGVYVTAAAGSGGMAQTHSWISSLGIWYALRADGMARAMVLLTVVLVPIVILVNWNVGKEYADAVDVRGVPSGRWSSSTFVALTLMLEGLSLYVFLAADALLFYLAFEATLIPMYFLIGGWGGPKRGAAALKFLLYSLAGGLIMLFGVVGLGVHSVSRNGTPSFLLSDLAKVNFNGSIGHWLFIAFFIAFAIKAPMVPVHTWLPDVAEDATAGASALLVGILDKIGTFGMIRICLNLFPEASRWASPVVLVLAVISIFYGALMAVASRHLLRLVSYTSISHFGFMVLGIFAFTTQSLTGTIFYMLNHGFSTAALFLVVAMLIKRRGSADLWSYGGAQKLVPVAAGLFLVSGLSALSLPGTASFVSEFMVMAGAWQRHPVITAVSTLGTVLAALYILLAYQRTMTGPVTKPVAETMKRDLSLTEKLAMAPLIALILVFGIFPKPALGMIDSTAKATMTSLGMTDPAPAAMGGK